MSDWKMTIAANATYTSTLRIIQLTVCSGASLEMKNRKTSRIDPKAICTAGVPLISFRNS